MIYYLTHISFTEKINIEYNFFIAHHGSNVCDGFFGRTKQLETKEKLRNSQLGTLEDYKRCLEKHKNSTVQIIHQKEINSRFHISTNKGIKEIRKIHQFSFEKDISRIKIRHLSDVDEFSFFSFTKKQKEIILNEKN